MLLKKPWFVNVFSLMLILVALYSAVIGFQFIYMKLEAGYGYLLVTLAIMCILIGVNAWLHNKYRSR